MVILSRGISHVTLSITFGPRLDFGLTLDDVDDDDDDDDDDDGETTSDHLSLNVYVLFTSFSTASA
jgi:hypothetical protein